MNKAIAEIKSQILYLFIPMFVAIGWGITSYIMKWDDKGIDTLFIIYPSIGISSLFIFAFFHFKKRRITYLILGIIYLSLFTIMYFNNFLLIKTGDNISVALILFNILLYAITIIIHLLNNKFCSKIMIWIYYAVLLSIIPWSLIGYIISVGVVLKIIYFFF